MCAYVCNPLSLPLCVNSVYFMCVCVCMCVYVCVCVCTNLHSVRTDRQSRKRRANRQHENVRGYRQRESGERRAESRKQRERAESRGQRAERRSITASQTMPVQESAHASVEFDKFQLEGKLEIFEKKDESS